MVKKQQLKYQWNHNMKQVNNINITDVKKEHDLVFIPSPRMRACKAKFWKRLDFDIELVDKVTLAGAIQLTNNTELNGWWKQDGFQDWFCNKDEASERIEYLYMLWMDKAEELLLNPDANHNAIVQIGKIIATLSGRDNQEKYSDDMINKMSKQQLQAFVERLAPKLLKSQDIKEPVIDEPADV